MTCVPDQRAKKYHWGEGSASPAASLSPCHLCFGVCLQGNNVPLSSHSNSKMFENRIFFKDVILEENLKFYH